MTDPGWRVIGPDGGIARWAKAALPEAVQALRATDQPLRCGGTWAVGLDLLPNASDGAVGGVALPWATLGIAPEPLHRAQVSAVYPGYPQPSVDETPAAFAFRQRRDAAHLDGLLPIGPDRLRMVKEPHGWILGLPLTECDAGAAPLVVWPGSHLILARALRAALSPHPPEVWGEVDVTEVYAKTRAEIFETCPRRAVPARPGQAIWLHRHLLHGVAPWEPGAQAPPEGRIIAYFRPLMNSVHDWLTLP